jgi:WhiB family redox-sensing transcriptional regulator
MIDGACVGEDPDLWFPDRGEKRDPSRIRHAKEVCGTCPVRRDCAAYAQACSDAGDPLVGIWGGLNERERRVRTQRRLFKKVS